MSADADRWLNPTVLPCERQDCGKPRGICGHIDSAADYHPGPAFDVLGKLRAAEAAISRVKALAETWDDGDTYICGPDYAADLRAALRGDS